MARIAKTIEGDPSWRIAMDAIVTGTTPGHEASEAWAMAHAVGSLATDLKATTVAVLTATGGTAKRVSQRRPGIPILALSDRPEVASWLSLWHGVVPVLGELETETDALIRHVDHEVQRLGYARPGDRIMSVGSAPRSNGTRAYFIEYHDLLS
jgi:pyruvate kinase